MPRYAVTNPVENMTISRTDPCYVPGAVGLELLEQAIPAPFN